MRFIIRTRVRSIFIAMRHIRGARGFELGWAVILMSGVSFDMAPILELSNRCFAHWTVSIATFVVSDKVRMDCHVARVTYF